MNATPSGPSTRCASATLFTCCTPFRRNRRKVSPRLGKKSNSSNNGSLRQNGTIERGTTEMKKNNIIRVKEGSGNVFADLGFPNPERERLKARLTLQIYRLIKDLGLTQAKAGAILGIRHPHVSGLMRGQSGNFSVERLMDLLTALGQDVEINVRPASREHGGVSLVRGSYRAWSLFLGATGAVCEADLSSGKIAQFTQSVTFSSVSVYCVTPSR